MQTESKQAPKKEANAEQDLQVHVQKRDGRVVPFQNSLIYGAIEKAFRAERETPEGEETDQFSLNEVTEVTKAVLAGVIDSGEEEVGIEKLQDLVEMHLMQRGHYSVARRYIVYREERAKARQIAGGIAPVKERTDLLIKRPNGQETPINWSRLSKRIELACEGLTQCSSSELKEEVSRSLYNGMKEAELESALILAARTRIEKDPEYQIVTARILLESIYNEVLGTGMRDEELELTYKAKFSDYIRVGVANERLSPEILVYDLEKITEAIKPERDHGFLYIGLQTVYDRYLLHVEQKRIETPQYFWMRVAMGLAAKETNREERAIEFYNLLSTFRFVSSTPTLFNAGTLHPQLSSCYLTTIDDDLEHIFKCVSDNAKLSKWAGGLGNDWTSVRATGSHIKGTNGQSQGVVPFLKVANDVAIAVNQGGKRKGAVCAYLESWHLEVEEFLELRKNTGDERRRTHDMNTANWIPDLFMERVFENGTWTLFSPNEVPDLHDIYGEEFKARYTHYEQMAVDGEIKQFRQMPAVNLWRKMLSMVFETGHPWITFKDPSNIRSPQSHVGVVHSSNLCTEILLNTSREETAVCNLGSINLVRHVESGHLDEEKIQETITTAVRMLDNVIDINFYPTKEAADSNKKHRPVGLGMMGFQDALYEMEIGYGTDEAVDFADHSMEVISYYAISASSALAKERGAYGSYRGSKWSKGLLPIDTLKLLEEARKSEHLEVDYSSKMDWTPVRESVAAHGMRNSNVMAIAPTATIANISGVTQSIEPTFRNLFVKSNLSGEFTVVNPYLVKDLKKENLWDSEMIDDLKYHDGVLADIERVPDYLKVRYVTAFEIDQRWLIECASRRQKWIDMGQSLNLYINMPSGKAMDDMYKFAWIRGLKTTYYLRSLGATQIEKSSIDINKHGVQPKWMKSRSASSDVKVTRAGAVCNMDDPDCDACQ